MKKRIFLLFLSIFFFIIHPSLVAAQTASGLKNNGIDIPGVTCGVAGSKESNACCTKKQEGSFEDQLKSRTPDPCLINVGPIHGFCLHLITDPVISLVSGLPVVNNILALSRQTPVNSCVDGAPDKGQNEPGCKCVVQNANSRVLCDEFLKNTGEYNRCISCAGQGIWTGLGCVHTDVAGFVQNNLIGWGMSLAGIVAFLCIIYSAFILQTSQGNPERLKKAREYLNSCLIGLGLIVFSVLILRIIGVNILNIPGFR